LMMASILSHGLNINSEVRIFFKLKIEVQNPARA
jgi:hypothetical protein